jgi:hypothetical protein
MSVKIEVVFDRDRAIAFYEALGAGQALGPIEAEELLALAGACLCRRYQAEAAQLDADETTRLVKNMMNAAEHCAEWTLRACQGTYDRDFKPHLHATIDNGQTSYPGKRGAGPIG